MIPKKTLHRLMFGFLLISPIPLAILSIIYIQAFEKSLRETVLSHLTVVADNKMDQIDTYINEELAHSTWLAKSNEVLNTLKIAHSSHPSGLTTQKLLKSRINYYKSYFKSFVDPVETDNILIIDDQGNVVFSASEETNLGNLLTGPFKNSTLAMSHREAMSLLDSQIFISPSYPNYYGKPTVFITSPVFTQGQLLGSVAIQLNIDKLSTVLSENYGLGETGETIVAMEEKDQALFLTPLRHVHTKPFKYLRQLEELGEPLRRALYGEHSQGLSKDYLSADVVAAWRYIPSIHSGAVIKIDQKEAFAPVHQLRNYSVAALALLLVLATALAYFLSKSFIVPIQRLIEITKNITHSKSRSRAIPEGPQEFRSLALSFNQMADKIDEREHNLESHILERTKELNSSNQRYKDLTENIPIGVYSFRTFRTPLNMPPNINGRFEYVSAQLCRLCRLKPEDFYQDANLIFNLAHPEDRHSLITGNNQAAQELRPFQWEGRFLIGNETRSFLIESRPTLQTNNDCVWNGIVVDITERKQFESELIKAREAADIANKIKSEFVANMSHEIRTPMNAIIGLTQLALDTDLSPAQGEYLRKVHSSSKDLLHLLNDILDYSKIEAGKIEIKSFPTRLTDVLQNSVNLFSAQATQKNLKINWSLDTDIPSQILCDPLRLSQILNNLLSNAIKFTEKGKIDIFVNLKTKQKDHLTLLFSIHDTGIGISPQQMENLFIAFSQADSTITRRYGGTGLGLVISKKLVSLMGGEINASSVVGVGTTFYFTIKAEALAEAKYESGPKEAPHTVANFPGSHILLVEDNKLNQEVAYQLLKKRGVHVTIASNGKEALEICEGKKMDLIFMDLHMPIMDGFEAAVKIKQLSDRAQIPIIAMTAAVMQEDRDHCIQVGMVDFIAKPFDQSELDAILRTWLKPSESLSFVTSTPKKVTTLVKGLPDLDFEEALDRIDGDEELLARLFHLFRENEFDSLRRVQILLQKEDRKEAAFLVHRIRGSAENIGAKKLYETATRLEQELISGATLQSSQEFFDSFQKILSTLAEM